MALAFGGVYSMKLLYRILSVAATATVISLVWAGCSRAVDLEPYSTLHSTTLDATHVVVGIILSDIAVRKPIPSRRNDGYPMQLRRLRLRTENILKGDLKPGTIAVYYFHLAGGFNGPRPLGQWAGATRRIFQLRQDASVLRTACDGYDNCTWPVRSGAHPQYRLVPTKPLGYALVDILFTRGEGTIDSDFARGIDDEGSLTLPEAYVLEKLQELAATESPIVRAAACRQLSYHHQKCIESRTK
jgi:hypothetical protein